MGQHSSEDKGKEGKGRVEEHQQLKRHRLIARCLLHGPAAKRRRKQNGAKKHRERDKPQATDQNTRQDAQGQSDVCTASLRVQKTFMHRPCTLRQLRLAAYHGNQSYWSTGLLLATEFYILRHVLHAPLRSSLPTHSPTHSLTTHSRFQECTCNGRRNEIFDGGHQAMESELRR